MIRVAGDSHAYSTFRDIPGICHHILGPVTLKRVGYMEDDLLPAAVSKMGLRQGDVLFLCFGEIDIRCWAKIHLERRRDHDLRSMLSDWIGRYLARAVTLDVGEARVGIVSIPPPATSAMAMVNNALFPVVGSDEERSRYTAVANELLEAGCSVKHLLYLDVYSRYKDENGMLMKEKSDGHVHIADGREAQEALVALGLLANV